MKKNNLKDFNKYAQSIQKHIIVERGHDGVYIQFKVTGQWEVRVADTPDELFNVPVFARSTGKPVEIRGLHDGKKYYFLFKLNGDKEVIVTSDFVTLEGQSNFRDLGGFVTEEGRKIKNGLLFRSGALNHLTDHDLDTLTDLNIKTILDFRDKKEAKKSQDRCPGGAVYKNVPINVGNTSRVFFWLFLRRTKKITNYLLKANRTFVKEFSEEFKEYVRLISDRDNLPLVFHCAAGKDRTGFAAMLFLSAMGVSRKDIVENYMDSNMYNKEYIELITNMMAERGFNTDALGAVLKVEESYINTALDIIDNEYGGPVNYLKEVLGADIEQLKQIYLV